MFMTDEASPTCEHIFHENGIHEFIIGESRLEGAYAYLEQIEPIYASRTNDSTALLVIINSTGDFLPMNYGLLQHTKDLLAKYPNIGMSYTAILTDDSIASRLANSFVRLLRFSYLRVRFFNRNQYSNAVDWLLEYR